MVVAENKAGSDRTRGRLDVEKESNIDNKPIVNPSAFAYLNRPDQPVSRDPGIGEVFPPRVVVPLSNIHTTEGKPSRLACRIEGNPKPTVSDQFRRVFLFGSRFLNAAIYVDRLVQERHHLACFK